MADDQRIKPEDFIAPPDKLIEKIKARIIHHWGWSGAFVVALIALTGFIWWNWEDIIKKPFV